MSTLTDRYVWAVVRLLPEQQRPDIDAELRSLIDDMTEARRDAADDRAEPDRAALERAVLADLGDPTHLAARYTERPRALIGPHVFPAYVRTLKLAAAIVVPLLVALAVFGAVVDDAGAGRVVGDAVGALFNGTIQVAFWVTLFYAFADRIRRDLPWTPDELPEAPAPAPSSGARGDVGIGESALSMATLAVAGGALLWQHVRAPLRDAAGDRVPFLQPDLWDGAGWLLVALLVASFAVQVAVLLQRRWTWPTAVPNAAINGASLAVVAWLSLDDRLINGRFLEVLAERAGWDTVPTVDPWIPIALVAAVEVWDAADGILRARRTERAARRVAGGPSGTAPVPGR